MHILTDVKNIYVSDDSVNNYVFNDFDSTRKNVYREGFREWFHKNIKLFAIIKYGKLRNIIIWSRNLIF